MPNAVNGTRVEMAVYFVQKIWDALTKSCSLAPVYIVIHLYM